MRTRDESDVSEEEHAMAKLTTIGRRCAALLGALVGPLALLALSLLTRVVGSGRVASETRQVRDFDEVVLTGSGTLTITQTGEESLTIQADDNILPLLTSDVSGRRLTLGTKPNTSFSTRSPIIYRLTVQQLSGLIVSGSGDATATGITSSSMSVRISGSGSVTLAGTAERQEVTISGSGSYRADDFATKTAAVSVSGSGGVRVHASEQLDVHVSGSGSVEYSGSPAVSQRVSGSGRVRRR
jgi:hypothetical protein